MAGRSALGGFVEGLQGGMEFRQNAKRQKKIDRMLDQEGRLQAMAIEGKQMDINKVRAEKGLAPRDFSQFDASSDPYDFKLGDFFKPKKLWQNFKDNMGFGGAQSIDNPASPVQANEAALEDLTEGASASSIGMQGNTDDLNAFAAADGGKVPKYNRGGPIRGDYVRASQRLAAGGGRTAANAPGARGAIPRYVARQGGARDLLNKSKMVKAGGALATADALLDQTETGYGERMDVRFGDWGWGGPDKGQPSIGGAAEYGVKRALGFASDLGDALTFGQASRLYRDDRDSFGLGPDPEKRAAIEASDVPEPKPKPEQAPTAAQGVETRPAPAAPAAPQAPEVTGGPNQLADAPITDPGEMPTMNTEEWVAYRAASVESMLMQGMSLPEAHDAITTMQQKGFLNYGTQALQMLAAGDPARAAMALKAAYQYFPNGVDVRFGITKDKAGMPALVAMGSDENTGEATGAPMLVTGERLAVMMENMSNPEAFRTWTKDWREFEQDLREYYEVTKPEAESNAMYRDRMGRAALLRGEAELYNRMSGGGLDQADLDRAYAAMEKVLGEYGLFEKMSPQDMNHLRQLAALSYEINPGNYPNTIGGIIAAYTEGGLPAAQMEVDRLMQSGE